MRTIALILAIFFVSELQAQTQSAKPSIYIDCQMRCDYNFIKQEIQFVNYIQNRDESDIYILATRQRTGAGGDAVQLIFLGNGKFKNQNDTLNYITDPDATNAIERDQFVENIKKGLLPFLLESPLANKIKYTISAEEEAIDEIPEYDPWNYWVFNVGGNGSINGEASYSGTEISGRFSTSRVTNESKFRYFFRYNYEQSKFKLTDGEEFLRVIKGFSNYLSYVHSINDHWSAGFVSEFGSSTFGNTDFDGAIKPAVEYNIYPYDLATTKRFSFRYAIGPEYKDYTDITVYDKLTETVFRHNLRLEFEQTQKWGNLEFDVGLNQYLHDFDLWSMFFNPNLEWVIFKGLRLDMGGFASLVRDRINIAKSEITDEDILLQIKQLDTNFTYSSYVGINYRFGSKYNNFVNPRF